MNLPFRRKLQILLPILFVSLLIACNHRPLKGLDSITDPIDLNLFANPSAEYRATPFFSWNDSLYPAQIKDQIKKYKEGGVGGLFFHAREGLLTQYLSSEWWTAMDSAVQQCKDSGIIPWFYDEYKWPSGYAGGIVPRQSPNFRGKYLARIKKGEPLPKNAVLVIHDNLYQYVCMTAEMNNTWLNGTCKIDYFNPEAIQAFIKSTYKPYAKRNKEKYGEVVKGIFYDEPDIKPEASGPFNGVLSYSPWVRETFKKLKGYDIADKFDLLFEEKEGFQKVRLDYYQVVSQQYEESFSKQLGDFSRANGLEQTGHYFPEETLGSVKSGIGNLLRHLRHEDEPGMDHLELRVDGGLNVARSVSSVANQYGRKFRMSEVFGVSGQNMNFEDRKWIVNWHIVLGVNHFVEHLGLYSMRGDRKRDYPPVLSYQQPWWKYNKSVEDYFGRLSYLSTIGKYAANILVIHPQESSYLATPDELSKLDKNYYQLLDNLQQIHRDYDLGDEQIISEIGSTDQGGLKVGEMLYHQVIIPELLTLRESTIQLLLEFQKRGGKIIVLGNFPRWIDAQQSMLLDELKRVALFIPENTKEQLDKNLFTTFHLEGENSEKVYTQQRTTTDGEMLMLTNIDRVNNAEVQLSFSTEMPHAIVLDPASGKGLQLVKNELGSYNLNLPATGFVVVLRGKLAENIPVTETYNVPGIREKVMTLSGKWKGQRLDPNAVTLDFASYSTDNGRTFSEAEPVIGIAQRFALQHYKGSLVLRYFTEIQDIPNSCKLVAESLGKFQQISINGKLVNLKWNDFYRDYFFRSSEEISSFLKQGENVIEFRLDFIPPDASNETFSKRYGTELESIYLTGDFGVKPEKTYPDLWKTEKNQTKVFMPKPVHYLDQFVMTAETDSVNPDVSLSGYPFYAGSFALEKTIEITKINPEKQYWLCFPKSESIVFEAIINGKRLSPLYSSPWQFDLTGLLHSGSNTIRLEMTNSLRNLLGPHHQVGGELKGVSALSFSGGGGWPQDSGDFNWYELRLQKKTLKMWRDGYYCIPFGLLEPPVIEICSGE